MKVSIYFSLWSYRGMISIVLILPVVDFGFIEILDMFEFVMENGWDEFVLGGDNGDDIVSVLVLFVSGDVLALFYIEVASDFGEEDSEWENNNTPCVVDDVPDAGDVFLDSDEFRTEINWYAFKNSLVGQCVLVECPEELKSFLVLWIVHDKALGAIQVVGTTGENVLDVDKVLNELAIDKIVLFELDFNIGDRESKSLVYNPEAKFSLLIQAIILQRDRFTQAHPFIVNGLIHPLHITVTIGASQQCDIKNHLIILINNNSFKIPVGKAYFSSSYNDILWVESDSGVDRIVVE